MRTSCTLLVIVLAARSTAEESSGWSRLPDGFAPVQVRMRLSLGERPIDLRMPSEFRPGSDGSEDVVPESGIRVRLSRQKEGREEAPASGAAVVVLGPPEAGEAKVEVEADVPGLDVAEPVRFERRGSPDVFLLGVLGGGEGAGKGFLDVGTGRGVDFGGILETLDLRRLPSTASDPSTRTVRISGRVPRGRDVTVFRFRARSLAPVHHGFAAVEGSASSLAGWILSGRGDVAARARALLEERPFLEGSYLEIGDGWQGGGGRRLRGPARGWHAALEGRRRGREEEDGKGSEDATAGTVSRPPLREVVCGLQHAGFRTGIWIVPHGQGETRIFEATPGAFVRDARREPVPDGFLGRYVVDGSSPEGLAYLRDLFARLKAAGVTAIRVGGLAQALEFYRRQADVLAEGTRDPSDVLRSTVEAMRRGCGEETVLAGDWDTPQEVVGLLDARVPAVPAGVEPLLGDLMAACRSYPEHRRTAWIEDPPVLQWSLDSLDGPPAEARRAITEARSRIIFAAVTGRGLLVDESTREGRAFVPEPIGSWLPMAFSLAPVRPLDLAPATEPPRIWDIKVGADGGDVVAVVNGSGVQSARVPLRVADLALASTDRRLAFDLIDERFVGSIGEGLELFLLPGSCRLLSLVADDGRPRVVGVSRDPRGTVAQMAGAAWDAASLALRGTLEGPREGFTIALHVAFGPALSVEGASAEGAGLEVSSSGGHAAIRLTFREGTASARYEIRFAAARTGVPARADPPRDVRIVLDESERRPLISWSPAGGLEWWRAIAGFSILRDGVEIGRTSDLCFLDGSATRGRSHAYQVASVPRSSAVAADPSFPIDYRMPPAADDPIDSWTLLAYEPRDRPPARRRCATGSTLSVGGRRSDRGLGVRPPARLDYALDGDYEAFEALVGVDDAARFQGSVVFSVRVDGVERWKSPVIQGGGEGPRPVRVDTGGGRVLTLLVEEAGDGTDGDLADWIDARMVAVPVVALPNAHAHNDYLHPRPLLDALDRGFASVEADVFLADGALLVAHERSSLRPDRTLEALYLDPLLDRVRKNGGRVTRAGRGFTLLVDIKEDGAKTYGVLKKTLARYEEMLSVFRRDGVDARAVTVIISGDRPRRILEAEDRRLVAMDGRLPDLEGPDPPPATLIPLVSDNWLLAFPWAGVGEMPEAWKEKLRGVVDRAHAQGRRLRFWGTPDVPALWDELLRAGVDLVGTDDLDRLEIYLREREQSGR